MQVLDTTIANVSLPTIAGSLGVSPNQGTWIITSFAVANGISVPLTGWLMQRYGVVRTFVASVALFTIASFLCGIAWSFESLIAFRVLQGAVSGPMIPGSQALLMSIFPASRRGMALAIWSMTTLIAPVMGPLLGGYISDNYSWPWIFLINVPVGLLSGVRLLAGAAPATRRRPRACRSTASASRCWSSGSARCRSCSTRARTRAGSTRPQIVALAVVSVRRLRRVPDLGALREAPDRRPELLPQPQLRDRHVSSPASATRCSSATS